MLTLFSVLYLCSVYGEYTIHNEYTEILLLSQTYQRPIGDPTETQHRPTCLIGEPSEDGDQHATSETNMPAESNRNFNTFKYSYFYILFAYLYSGIKYWGMSVSDGSLMNHFEVSDVSPIRHVGF